MSKSNFLTQKDSVESDDEQYAVDERPELRPTVELRMQAKIDSDVMARVDGTADLDHPYGMTLEAEEKWEAREMEKERTRTRRRTQSSVREQGSRMSVARGAEQARREFERRAASVDPWLHPDSDDPREELEREQLAAVNQQAHRISQAVRDASTRAAVSRQVAERVADGGTVLGASVAVMDAERTRPGSVVPIGMLEEVSRHEVSIQGTVEVLWESSHPAISQVGLLEDRGERTKFTSWTRSRAPKVEVGDVVRMRAVAKNWYQGRVSVALTGDSQVVFLNKA